MKRLQIKQDFLTQLSFDKIRLFSKCEWKIKVCLSPINFQRDEQQSFIETRYFCQMTGRIFIKIFQQNKPRLVYFAFEDNCFQNQKEIQKKRFVTLKNPKKVQKSHMNHKVFNLIKRTHITCKSRKIQNQIYFAKINNKKNHHLISRKDFLHKLKKFIAPPSDGDFVIFDQFCTNLLLTQSFLYLIYVKIIDKISSILSHRQMERIFIIIKIFTSIEEIIPSLCQ
ncbi:unnamed protein product [Paramecium sonneborni]|uniref:Uncharacterized protein n=1 Tax=Paramecium sonneborni TaxID=65129 RepID=A0A8S1RQA6_9CILI|nr:unnamed protein product [Paramecium sonneborni]